MKTCPQCNRTFEDQTLAFCLYDGKQLVASTAPSDPTATTASAPIATARRRGFDWRVLVGVLVVVAVGVVWFAQSQRAQQSAQQAAVLAALNRSNEVDAEAIRTLDASNLTTVYTGPALIRHRADLDNLRGRGLFGIVRLIDSHVGQAQIQPDGRAMILWKQTYEVTLYSVATQQAVTQPQRRIAGETAWLERHGDDWFIVNEVDQ
jgi:hypothetical protein